MHPCTLAAMHHPLPVLKVIFSKKAGLLRCTALHYLLLIYCHKLHPLLTNFTHHIHRSASEQFTRTSSCMRVGEYTSLGSTLFPRVKPMESLERKVWFFSVLPLNNLPVVETMHTSASKDQISIRQELLRVVAWAAARLRLT